MDCYCLTSILVDIQDPMSVTTDTFQRISRLVRDMKSAMMREVKLTGVPDWSSRSVADHLGDYQEMEKTLCQAGWEYTRAHIE
jgi:hypothetical protein